MLKLGLVGGAKAWHGIAFSEIINGYDRQRAAANRWRPLCSDRLERDDVRITHIWDPNGDHASEVAVIAGIPNVVGHFDEMIGEIDGALIVDDCSLSHQKRAVSLLRAGVPTFIDKPLASTTQEAADLFDLAERSGAPLMSCSAFRFARETVGLRNGTESIGEIRTGCAVIREERDNWTYYGVHPVELIVSILGPDFDSVRNIGAPGRDIVEIRYSGNRSFLVIADGTIEYFTDLYLYGTAGVKRCEIGSAGSFYTPMLSAVVTMIETGSSPVSREDTLAVIRILEQARQSAEVDGAVIRAKSPPVTP